MFKTSAVAALSALLFVSSINAAPLDERQTDVNGPKVKLIFYSDTACNTTVPPTGTPERTIYGDVSCYVNPTQAFSSLQILSIDDQFIGTNTALEVGHTNGDTCDGFSAGIKFDVSNRDTVGECQYIGIPQPYKPNEAGNEYRLTSLEG